MYCRENGNATRGAVELRAEMPNEINTIQNAWNVICEFEYLVEADHSARKGKRYRAEVLAFTANLEHNLFQIQEQMIAVDCPLGPYRKPGPGWYYLKLDISKFFYRVNHAKLLKILAKRIKDPELMKFLGSVVNSRAEPFGLPRGKAPQDTPPEEWLYDVGMPIGNLTSQLFANIYMNELDQYCKHVLKIHYYIRYMDDIVILGENKETLHEWKEKIETFLHEELELDLNNKTCIRPVRMGVEFVGVRIWPAYMKLRKSTVGRLKREVKKISELYASGQMDEEAFKRRAASIKGLLEHTESESLRWRLNQIYLDAVRKYGKTDPEETLWKGKNDGKKVA